MLSAPGRAGADQSGATRTRPSWIWLGTQLVPSPEVLVGEGGTRAGLRWQLTPLLFSWGLRRRVPRWRSWIVEPLARHAGSAELYASPGLILGEPTRALVRAGGRVYAPLAEHGEALSASFGASYQQLAGQGAVALEGGLYFLFGILGVQVSHTVGQRSAARSIFTLSVRYF
jgi:hypothetical protein